MFRVPVFAHNSLPFIVGWLETQVGRGEEVGCRLLFLFSLNGQNPFLKDTHQKKKKLSSQSNVTDILVRGAWISRL